MNSCIRLTLPARRKDNKKSETSMKVCLSKMTHHYSSDISVEGERERESSMMCSAFFTYGDGDKSTLHSFQISTGDVLLCFLFRINNISIERMTSNFTLVPDMIALFRRIDKVQLILMAVEEIVVVLKNRATNGPHE